MRKLKFHEKKLLKKVDFLQWKKENSHRELQVRLHTFCICARQSRPALQLTSRQTVPIRNVCACAYARGETVMSQRS